MTEQRPLAPAFPLTDAQEGLWFFQALDPSNPILNTGQYLDLSGPLNVAALLSAADQALAETEALRLRFHAGAQGPEQWLAEAPRLTVVDLSDAADPEATALNRMRADTGRALDLARDPVACFTLFRIGPDRHFLYERIHHLAIDGYGMVLLTNRIGELYSARVTGAMPSAPFPPLSRAFDEDVSWRGSDRRMNDRAFWMQALADLPEVTGPAPGRAVSAHSFLRESRWLPDDLGHLLERFSQASGLMWPDVLTGLVAAYIARWTGGEAVVGVPFMARMGSKAARLPCMVMNVLPFRCTPDEDADLPAWLAAVSRDLMQGRRHGRYRSEQMRRDLGLVGGARRLYGPLVNVQPFDKPPVFAGLGVGLHILGAGAVDDLTLTFRGDPASGILFEVDANPGLYTPQDVAGHADRLPAFLAAALAAGRLADVPTAAAPEVAAIRARGDATHHPLPDSTLWQLIHAQMQATPRAVAVTFGDDTLTYADLDHATAALVGRLAQMGAGPDRLVAVALNRSAELPVALVAALRAGAAYLPLDPEHPPERLARILQLAKPVAVLTSPDLAHLFPPDAPVLLTTDWPQAGEAPDTPPAPGDMAYVIYTSGSTGEPKGVVIEHRAIVNRLLWMRDHYGFDATDRILQKTPATFDVSVWEFFLPLITGARLVMALPGAHRDPVALARIIRDDAITTLHFVPSMLSAFLAAPQARGLAPRRVFCSGEELTADQRDRFHRTLTAELHNLYGPTEAAVDVSFWSATPDDTSNPLPIGFPVWNTRLEVLDDRMRPVPPGLSGSLYLGGIQLARGYLGRPDLTADRFIPDPHRPGERLYATGDLARLRHDGAVLYLGRSDHQVKIRGLRIELGEIEAAIMATGLARETVVLAREDRGEKRLVAYVVPSDSHAPGLLAQALAARLPAYMIPAAEVVLDALPVTSNGKLDRKALPAPLFAATGRAAEGATEILLARLYAEVLRLPEPAPAEADFFALGGDSLSAVRLLLRIAEETGRDPGLGTVFENPVLAGLATALDRGTADDGLGPAILLAEGDRTRAPLFLIHPAGGLSWGYRGLARAIAPVRAVWGLQHPGLDPDTALPESLSALAEGYARRIAEIAPAGAVHLAGWSVGGIIAQEVAMALVAMARKVGMVAALDSYPADCWRAEPEPSPVAALRALLAITGEDPEAHPELITRAAVVAHLRQTDTALGALPDRVLDGVIRTVTDTNRLVRNHWHRPMPGTLTHIRAGLDHAGRGLTADLWAPWADRLICAEVPFLHPQMTGPEAVRLIAPLLSEQMAAD
ncbi:MAG: amino acid adenylation domain-containing protein [Paracoccaceae bacterium]